MFFTNLNKRQLASLVDSNIEQNRALAFILNRIKNMPTRAELDAALQQNEKDTEDAIQRWQDQMKKASDDQAKALSDLQAKIDAKEDFSAELATLKETHNNLQTLAATPIAAVIDPPGTLTSTLAGAAGHTVGGAEGEAAAVAAGGVPVEGQGDHPGNTPTPVTDPPTPVPEPVAAALDATPPAKPSA